jgi:hypothetical protein
MYDTCWRFQRKAACAYVGDLRLSSGCSTCTSRDPARHDEMTDDDAHLSAHVFISLQQVEMRHSSSSPSSLSSHATASCRSRCVLILRLLLPVYRSDYYSNGNCVLLARHARQGMHGRGADGFPANRESFLQCAPPFSLGCLHARFLSPAAQPW